LIALRSRVLKGVEVEALAECAFRLAVHPSTPPERSGELLQLAMRTDAANPKFPYHLARLYFRNGDLERAGIWLNRARKLSPTSHRIWTHIGLLQRELNEIYNRRHRENKGYQQDEHKARWKEISEAVRGGSDQFAVKLARFQPDLETKAEGADPKLAKPAAASVTEDKEEAAERLTGAGVCRWTRIVDLMTEDLLEADPGTRTRDAMREMMQQVAAAAPLRIGGRVLFCVLAIEWVLRGYTAAFIRRIRPEPDQGSAADSLLGRFLELIQTPRETLPAALSTALAEGHITPLLAAAIHRQFVLGPPVNNAKLAADLRRVREASAGASDEECSTWLRTLAEDATVLDPKPFAAVADFALEEAAERKVTPQESLAEIKQRLDETREDVKRFKTWLDERKASVASLPKEDILEANRIRKHVFGIPQSAQDALTVLKQLRDSGSVQDFAETIEGLENGWQTVNTRALVMLLKPYPVVDIPPGEDATATPIQATPSAAADASAPSAVLPSGLDAWIAEAEALHKSLAECRSRLSAQKAQPAPPELAASLEEAKLLLERASSRSEELLGNVKRLRDSGKLDAGQMATADRLEQIIQGLQPLVRPLKLLVREMKPATEPASATPQGAASTGDTPKLSLESARRDLEDRLTGYFDSQSKTLSAYTPAQAAEAPLQALRMSVTARKAETLYRLGRRGDARSEWAGLLKEDVFDLRVQRNIAICDTVEGNVQRYLASWRDYAEMLYFQAAVLNDVTYLAREREVFHQNFGNAYALRYLYEEKSGTEEPKFPDPAELDTFLKSPLRVRHYVQHQTLAFFNSRMDVTVAPLILGVTRSAAEPQRDEARLKLQAWSTQLCALLPARAGVRYARAVSLALDSAAQTMQSVKRMRDLANTKEYKDAEGKYLKWIGAVIGWKLKIYKLVKQLPAFNGQPGYLDMLAAFSDADTIPLDTSLELLEPVARRTCQNAEMAGALVEAGCYEHTIEILQFVFPKHGADGQDKETQRQALYAQLTGDLSAGHMVAKLRALIDNPGNLESLEFYPPAVLGALQNGSAQPGDVEFLGRLHRRYPRSGGIAFHYALLLLHTHNLPESKKAAAAGVSQGFHESSRKQCQELLDQIRQAER
jgi:hypothetical protein